MCAWVEENVIFHRGWSIIIRYGYKASARGTINSRRVIKSRVVFVSISQSNQTILYNGMERGCTKGNPL